MTAHAPDRKIGDLQALRGVSIALVLLQHFSLTPTLLGRFAHPVALPFWLGVEVFFVISGYVIATSLMRDRFEPLSFFVKRVFRLTPALALMVGVCALFNWHTASQNLSGEVRQSFVVEWADLRAASPAVLLGYFTLEDRPIYAFGAMWSLSVEDQFYAALTLVCLAVTLAAVAVPRTRRDVPRALSGVVFALAVGLSLAAFATRVNAIANGTGAERLPAAWRYVLAWRFDCIAWGVVLAFADRRWRRSFAAFFADRGPFWSPFLLMAPLAVAALGGKGTAFGLTIVVAQVCFGLLVLAAAHDRMTPPVRGRAFRVWTYLGDRSYTIYLFHFVVMLAVWYLAFRLAPAWAAVTPLRWGVVQMVGTLLILLPLVEVVYRGVELPLTRVGRRLADRVRIMPAEAVERAVPRPVRRAA